LRILKKSLTVERDVTIDRNCQTLRWRINTTFAKFAASGFLFGYFPFAQGTVGSLWGPLLYLFIPKEWCVNYYWQVSLSVFTGVIIIYFLGVWSAGVCETFWGHDPGRIVIDEVAGMLLTLAFIPLTLKTVWMGFFLFRAFDIVKPPPARRSEKLPRGWGVMTDDIVAGVYANICLRAIVYVFPSII